MILNDMVKRDLYIKRIQPYIDKPLIKVITGLRRCGKSSLLLLIMEELRERGIRKDHIIYINFENLDFEDIRSPRALHEFMRARMNARGRYYILLDEIQEVNQWERAVNSLLAEGRADIFVTGSNSRLLSSELATYIAGRYVEINVKTLSFAEFRKFREARGEAAEQSLNEDFRIFIRTGGFPVAHVVSYEHDDEIYRIVYDIYSSAVLRDAVQRQGIRNVKLLDRVLRYLFDNMGNIFSAKGVADFFKSQQRKLDPETVYNYLRFLEDAFIVKRISRYDIKGREILKTQEKYYLGDHSLLYGVMGYKDRMIAGVLENIVLHELERRDYRVFVGKLDDREIDFIGERRIAGSQNEKIYVQVAYKIGDSRETIDREFGPLLSVKDHYPKYVVSMDDFWRDNIEGVKHKSIAEFLLMQGNYSVVCGE
jgi:predicted AAA+ superfamily ATPase